MTAIWNYQARWHGSRAIPVTRSRGSIEQAICLDMKLGTRWGSSTGAANEHELNAGHSRTDEHALSDTTYDLRRTLYRQPAISGPVVNPLLPVTDRQLMPDLVFQPQPIAVFDPATAVDLANGFVTVPGINLGIDSLEGVVYVADGAPIGGLESGTIYLASQLSEVDTNFDSIDDSTRFQFFPVQTLSGGWTGTTHAIHVPASGDDNRGKAIMSYAENRLSTNVFFEPIDLLNIYGSFAGATAVGFVRDLQNELSAAPVGSVSGTSAALSSIQNATATEPRPEHVDDSLESPALAVPPGFTDQRLFVSGSIGALNEESAFRIVEPLGNQGPITIGFSLDHWIVQLDADGTEVARHGIRPQFGTSENDGEAADSLMEAGVFQATILKHEQATQLELRHDETVLASFTASVLIPAVNLQTPVLGDEPDGSVALAWNVENADAENLQYTILYSADDGLTWAPIAFPSEMTFEIPKSRLAGSDQGRLQVIASSGLNFGSAISEPFQIPFSLPRPFISTETSAGQFLESDRIRLVGGALDIQDTRFTGDSLRWHSDRDGYLGTGAELFAKLGFGEHRVTLTATNSAGLHAIATTIIQIEGDYDLDGISDREEIRGGLNPLVSIHRAPDADGDGLPLRMELRWGTNPNSADSDGDGRSDAQEIREGTLANQSDHPLPQDTLTVLPESIGFDADLSLDGPLPQRTIHVISREIAEWELSANVPWLSASGVLEKRQTASRSSSIRSC